MYKLLVVDDEAIEREAIQYFIQQAGLKFEALEEATNGIEAVSKAAALEPQIIIMDIRMPGKDGLEAAKEIRQFNSDCKIIFLTAFSEFEYAQKAIKVKAEDFIIKPADSEALLRVLNSVITDLDRGKAAVEVVALELTENFHDGTGTEVVVNGPNGFLVDRVCKYIDQNYNKCIKLDELCDMVGFSKYYLSRIFKQYKNMNLVDYIAFRRIEKTKEILKDPRVSIKEISSLVGYNDPNYLTNVFKKWEGISPTEYRNKLCR
jgi:YesN/AraC family two-component response regulator